MCLIVFIETGFFVGFFLPAIPCWSRPAFLPATGHLHLAELLLLVPLCAIVGDQIGYWIGRKAGQALYRREDSSSFGSAIWNALTSSMKNTAAKL